MGDNIGNTGDELERWDAALFTRKIVMTAPTMSGIPEVYYINRPKKKPQFELGQWTARIQRKEALRQAEKAEAENQQTSAGQTES